MDAEILRTCRKCGVSKPIAAFSKNSSKAGGLNTECKDCFSAYRKEYRSRNVDKLKAKDAEYYARNAARVKANVAEYRKANREKLSAAVAAYKAANIEEISTYQAEYRRRYKVENPEKYAACKKAWAAANPESLRLKGHRRRVKAAGGKLSKGLISALFALQKGRCACCGADLSQTGYHVDHIMPLALGGSNTDDNVQLLTPACNLRKGAMHPDDYRRKLQAHANDS